MKRLHAGTGMLVGVLALGLSAHGLDAPAQTREAPTVVVGTFDSRAVAIAYVRSDEFSDYMRAQAADIEKAVERAKAAGDSELVQALGALGPEMQERVHAQSFGAAPVGDILARIQDDLPSIAEQAGVNVIVSKWSLTYRDPKAEFVDVTDLLAAEFDPDEETLKTIREVVATKPVPLDQLDHDH